MPRITRTAAAVALAATLAAPLASAHPGPADLDRRRGDMLDEMHTRISRWKTPPPPAPSPAPADEAPPVVDDGPCPDADDIEGMSDAIDDAPVDAFAGVPETFDEAERAFDETPDAIDETPDAFARVPDPIVDGSAAIDAPEQRARDMDVIAADDAAGDFEPPAAVEAPRAIDAPAPDPAPADVEVVTPPPLPAPPAPEATRTDDGASTDARASSLDAPLPLGRHDAGVIAAAVLAETNAARARHGLRPLALHPILDAASVEFAQHLARTGRFGHIDPSRPALETPGDRVRAAGGADGIAAENLITETWLQVDSGEPMYVVDAARHQYSRTPDGPLIPVHTPRTIAASMVQRWLDSPGHRRNILDVEARQMGFGMAWAATGEIPSLVAVQLFQRYHGLGEGRR